MNFFRRISFNLWYFLRPPWESGITPPEVEDFIRNYPAGRALDLGCGTGTSSLALAKANWSVIGVDFAPRAIGFARKKARKAGVNVDFRVDDATRLGGIRGPFDLVLDVGCFHGLPGQQKRKYIANLETILIPGGTWLLYGFFKPDGVTGPGLSADDLLLAQRHLKLVKRQDGVDKKDRPSAWFWFRR